MTSNFAEAYNSVLVGARGLPLKSLVKKIFYNCVHYWDKRQGVAAEAIASGHVFTKWASDKIDLWENRASSHHVIRYDRIKGVCEVLTGPNNTEQGSRGGGRTMIVDLVNHTCSCNKWQIFRIPCAHGIAACNYFRLDWKSLVGHWYKWSHVQQCYSTRFSPIGDEINWGDPANFPQLIPDPDPRRIRSRGKPRKKRFKMEMDIRGSCGHCDRIGHNARNCLEINNEGIRTHILPTCT